LRDVFRRLAGEGYLEIVSNRGASVASMNHKTLRNFFLTAPMLYAAVGRLAAMNATPKQIESMRAAQREFRNAALRQDSESLIYWNDRFHTLMGEMAANPYLKPSYERLLIDHARISQTFYRPRDPHMTENMQQALDQHDAMIECIANSQSDAMVELIREHWELSRSHMETYVHPDPLPIE
jgi:DNA-binding GntR family transcriptional regulator